MMTYKTFTTTWTCLLTTKNNCGVICDGIKEKTPFRLETERRFLYVPPKKWKGHTVSALKNGKFLKKVKKIKKKFNIFIPNP